MCKVLGVPRGLVYYNKKGKRVNSTLENEIIKIFKKSRNNYGSRKIKVALKKQGKVVSRRKIREIMKKYNLISNYWVKQFKVHKTATNNDNTPNIVDRNFKVSDAIDVVVSDLTYVKVKDRWCYICLIVALSNREIIGYSAGRSKSATLVYEALLSSTINLSTISVFHTDRGSEFKNSLIDKTLQGFGIKRSLSKKGCPYDNAVAESTYKIIKTEFTFNKTFDTLDDLKIQLADYVNWFNNHRIHGALGYLTPSQFKNIY